MTLHAMDILLASTIKISILLALALGATVLARRRSAALRHWILATSIACAALLPALETVLPAWQVPLLSWRQASPDASLRLTSAEPPAAGALAPAVVSRGGPSLLARLLNQPELLAASVWAGGTATGLAILLAGLWRLRRLARRARVLGDWRFAGLASRALEAHGIRRPVLLLQSAHPTLVVTWGVLRPRVLLPAGASQWSEDRMRVVLVHELAHVRRADWWIQMLGAVLRCVYWFNPLVWIACRRLRHESEHASDDLVLRAGVSGAHYATHLLAVARDAVRQRHAWMPATAIARPSTLEGRIRAMLNHTLNRDPLGRTTCVATALAATVVTLMIAAAALSAREAAGAQEDSPGWNTDVRQTQQSLDLLAEETNARVPAAQPNASEQSATQAPSAFVGTVYDQLGGLLPGTFIGLAHSESGGTYQTVTDYTGSFAFRDLPPGDYALEVRLPGFSTVRTAVTVARDVTAKRNISLPLGSLEETIFVTGERFGAPQAHAEPPRRRAQTPRTARTMPDPRQATLAFPGGIGGNIKQPTKIVNVNPIYPAEMQAAGKSGFVLLTGRIGIDGYMSDLRPADSVDADPAFVASAIAAAQRWEFTPTLLNGVPVDVNVTITVSYDLR